MAEVDSDEDLTKDLQPLAYHVSNRKGVFREAIKALKGKRLEAMIPPMLKSWDRSRLECACVEILEELDDDTLLAILDGRVGTAGVSAVEQTTKATAKPKKLKKLKVSKDEVAISDEPKKKKKKKVLEEEDQTDTKLAKLKKKKKLAKAKAKIKKKKKDAVTAVPGPGDTSAVAPHKSLMELLELEYRAKAIKALLRSQGQMVPGIPINIEDEDNDEIVKEPEVSETNVQNKSSPSLLNGNNTATKSKSRTRSDLKNISDKPSKDSTLKPSENKLKRKKEMETITTSDQSTKQIIKPSCATPEPKKQVMDLIDEALNLNTSFNEETDSKSVLAESVSVKPAAVIINACTRANVDEDELRSKLVQKFHIQKEKKKRKKKPKLLKDQDEEEDILDLHPQELGLSDEERETNNNSSSSPESSDSEEIKEAVNESALKNDVHSSQISNVISKVKVIDDVNEEEEELIYDDVVEDDEDEEEEDEVFSAQEIPIIDDNVRENETSVKSNELRVREEQDNDNDSKDGEISHPPEGELKKTQISTTRLNIGSEKIREGVFETSVDNVGFSIKRKIAFRIDPARIGALEEKGAEEAKKAEERKREEEDNLKNNQNFVEDIEEGEIDSNEEDSALPEPKVSRTPSPRTEKDKIHSSESDNSDDSENSTSPYGRRRRHRREKYTRDFGAYSPKRVVENVLHTSEEPKRTSSPVEYISQFSDMEPISDDSNQSIPRKLPVSGCERNETQTKPRTPENKSKNDSSQECLPMSTEKLESNNEKTNKESDDDEYENADLDNPKPITWYERWAQSHGMQKVVKTNKIHKKVRSKLKKLSDKKKPIEIPKDEPSIEAEPIIGSIEEYEKLFGKKVVPIEDVDSKTTQISDLNATNAENNDDDDEDDLWGDIIGGS